MPGRCWIAADALVCPALRKSDLTVESNAPSSILHSPSDPTHYESADSSAVCILFVASVPGLPRYAASVNCARAGHTENGEGLG